MKNRFFYIICLVIPLVLSCKGLHQVACTDFSDNPSFSYRKKSHHHLPKTRPGKKSFSEKDVAGVEKETQQEPVTQKDKPAKKEFSKPFKPKREYKKKVVSTGCKQHHVRKTPR